MCFVISAFLRYSYAFETSTVLSSLYFSTLKCFITYSNTQLATVRLLAASCATRQLGNHLASVLRRHAQVMDTSIPTFLSIWGNDKIRACLLSKLDEEALCTLRLTSSECCRLTTPILFTRTRLTFTPSALTRPSRVQALCRIGHHIEHLTFSMPHTESIFLPPLLNPLTGREVTFLYTPHTSLASESQRPKYGTQELGNVLTQQYPPNLSRRYECSSLYPRSLMYA